MHASHTFSFETGVGNSNGTLYVPDSPNGLGVLMVHGILSQQDGYAQYAQALADSGVICLTFDLSGHGQSAYELGDRTVGQHIEEVGAAYAYLAKRPEAQNLNIVAASYGAHLSSVVTESHDVRGMLLRAPAVFPDGIDDVPFREHDADELAYFQQHCLDGVADADLSRVSRSLGAISRFIGLVTIVRSEFDEVVPETMCRAYTEVANNSHEQVIYGAKHSLNAHEKDQLQAMILDWSTNV
jgi:uncharacterized protein